MKIKYGIKIWSSNEIIIKLIKKHFLKKDFDFIELTAIQGSFNEELLTYIKGIPTIIHCDNNNVNFANENLREGNITVIKEAQKFADFLNAKFIIVHPGYGNVLNVNKLLKEFDDKRFCLENMPGKTMDMNSSFLGRTAEELKNFNFNNFCLDISHAIKSAISLNLDIFENIGSLLKFNPRVFHISDSNLDNEYDEHLNIGEGDYDFEKIALLLKTKLNAQYITLETPKSDYTSIEDDLTNLKKIKAYFD